MIRPGRPDGATDETDLVAGLDFRKPEYRRETFLRFYEFHLRHRAHPGGVYHLIPYLRERLGWDDEEALWYAFLNGNTQHPVTSLILHDACPRPTAAGLDRLTDRFYTDYARLSFDTDRRHHKKSLLTAVSGYLSAVGSSQAEFWRHHAERGFCGIWEAATAIPTFGRLSAFSYSEYLTLVGFGVPCDTLFLDDRSGSRSHRNGLSIVLGREDLDWHDSNPGFDGRYPPDVIDWLAEEAARLLAEARSRIDHPDVGYFTLESAFCTYKSWHRPNRRYPNVYNDMAYDRIRAAERAWPDRDLSIFWDARAASL